MRRSPCKERILSALANGDLTRREIAEVAHVSERTLEQGGYLADLKRDGQIYICGWRPPAISGAWSPVFRLGAGENAVRPPAASPNEYARRWRHKLGNERARLRRIAARPIPIHALDAALMGRRVVSVLKTS